MVLIVVLMIGVIGLIVFVERGQRKIPFNMPNGLSGAACMADRARICRSRSTRRVIIPPIFCFIYYYVSGYHRQFYECKRNAVDATRGQFGRIREHRCTVSFTWHFISSFFCYFYTAVHFNPVDVAENMKRYGGFIPGLRPGKNTADYIDRVLMRIIFRGHLRLGDLYPAADS